MARASGFAPANGTRLYYELAGDGEPLVLIHGFSLDRRMWDAQFEPFAQRYRVLRYDGRGFGKSDPPLSADYDPVSELKALLDHLNITSAHILGFSLGGALAIDFALAYPGAARSLIAVDSVLSGRRWSEAWVALDRPVWKQGRSGDLAGARALWLSSPIFAPAQQNPQCAGPLAQMIDEYSGWHWANGWPRPGSQAAERLAELRMPVLSITGERDLADFHEVAAALERDAHARRVILPRVGHMSPMEDPEAFNRVVLDFLEACSSSPPTLSDDLIRGEAR